METIKLQLNKRLGAMLKEVEQEYNISPEECVLNHLDHYIKTTKDFLVGHRFELQAIVRQKQLEYEQATAALELHNARITNFDHSIEPVVTAEVEKPVTVKKPRAVGDTSRTNATKRTFRFTDDSVKALKDKVNTYYYDSTESVLAIRFLSKNKKKYYSIHNKQDFIKGTLRVMLGSTDEMSVQSARRKARKNIDLVASGINPNEGISAGRRKKSKNQPKNEAPLETDKDGYVDYKEFVSYKYDDLDILGIALKENKVPVNQCKKKFKNSIFKDIARQALDMWKNDGKTIGQICHLQLMNVGTPDEKPCSIPNMLLSRILKGIWHFGTQEEKDFIFHNIKGDK
tara:strand:+ start:1439 stop:2467 length:1029 start_codon:yes stop_codon:yes gene_type:complete